jgi:hypothetical protein
MSNWFEKADIGEDVARTLFKLRVEVDGRIVERDFQPDVIIDYENLEEQLDETPALFAFWSSLLAEGKKQSATLERMIKRRKGEVTKHLLQEAREQGVKLRGSDVEDLIETDDDLNKLEAKLIIANKTLSKLFAIVDAVRMKSEHLRSLAGFKRQEQRNP